MVILHDYSKQQFTSAEIPMALERYGPLLILLWSVSKDFGEQKKLVHEGQSVLTDEARHAMLIGGHRNTISGPHFVLQNCWSQP
jgi:hypothetical protein